MRMYHNSTYTLLESHFRLFTKNFRYHILTWKIVQMDAFNVHSSDLIVEETGGGGAGVVLS